MMVAQITNNIDLETATANFAKALFPHVTAEQIEMVVGALFILARVLRKALPDNIQTGKLGTFLKHTALEINPPTQGNPTPETTVQIQNNPPTSTTK